MPPQYTHFVADDSQPQQFSHFVPDSNSGENPVDSQVHDAPDSFLGGAGRELKNIGSSLMSAYKPETPAEAYAGMMIPGGAGIVKMAKGYGHSLKEGLHEAGQYAKDAMSLPAGNKEIKALDLARAGATAVGALNPLTSGTTENVNELSDQGRNAEAAGAGLTDAALLATPFGVKGAKMAVDAIPTTAKAGRLLNEVGMAAGNRPVSFTRTTPALEEAQRLSLWGHGNVTPLDSLYQRMNTVNPVDFEEARGRYSPLTRLTASDKMRATPQLQAAARRVAHAMKADIGDTAEQVGMRPQYEEGMSQYARAMRNRELMSKTAKWGGRAAAGALGLGSLYGLKEALK